MASWRNLPSKPVFWVTLVCTGSLSALTFVANPMGLPVATDSGVNGGRVTAIFGFVWFGVFFASVVCLGAWAALRDAPWLHRLAIPLALLVLCIVGNAAAARTNAHAADGSLAAGTLAAFATAFAVFTVLRWRGWKIGPQFTGRSAFSLLQMLFAVSLLSVAAAIWSWSSRDLYGRQSLSENLGGAAAIGAMLTIPSCLLAIPGIALVMKSNRRYLNWLGALLLIACAILLFGQIFSGIVGATVVMPISFVLIVMWVFYAYRQCGYDLTGQENTSQPRWRWFGGGACLVLGMAMLALISLSDLRAERAQIARWSELGIYPIAIPDQALEVISFYRSEQGITRAGIEALKKQPSLREINVECAATPEQIGWLLELSQVQAITLSGKNKRNEHLRALLPADHLSQLDLYDTSISIAEFRKAEKVLKNCELRMTNFAGAVIAGAPKPPATVKVQRQNTVGQ